MFYKGDTGMDIDRIAQNLYKKHEGRYYIYELEGHKIRFTYKGTQKRTKIASVKRNVFQNKIMLTSDKDEVFEFREPSFITRDENKIVFNYVNASVDEYSEEEDPLAEVQVQEQTLTILE